MDKLKLTDFRDCSVRLKIIVRSLIEIVDWINAYDKHYAKARELLDEIGSSVAKKVQDEIDKPSIEQELAYEILHWNKPEVARIYLPLAKYEELEKSRTKDDPQCRVLVEAVGSSSIDWNGIPVFSYSGDKIHYCSCGDGVREKVREFDLCDTCVRKDCIPPGRTRECGRYKKHLTL